MTDAATPGPWIVEDAEHPADIRIYGQDANRKLIAVVGNAQTPWTDYVEEWQANAALIVKAVNSFTALENFVHAYDAWRAANGVVGCNEDIVDEPELRALCAAEATAQVALIEARTVVEDTKQEN